MSSNTLDPELAEFKKVNFNDLLIAYRRNYRTLILLISLSIIGYLLHPYFLRYYFL